MADTKPDAREHPDLLADDELDHALPSASKTQHPEYPWVLSQLPCPNFPYHAIIPHETGHEKCPVCNGMDVLPHADLGDWLRFTAQFREQRTTFADFPTGPYRIKFLPLVQALRENPPGAFLPFNGMYWLVQPHRHLHNFWDIAVQVHLLRSPITYLSPPLSIEMIEDWFRFNLDSRIPLNDKWQCLGWVK